ncbi:MAG: hypothetical protein AAFZ74_00990 [Pseudomonadota bacterium]
MHVDIDSKVQRIDGVNATKVHSGQKRRYGDTYYEYEVDSDLSPEAVERICSEKIYPAISKEEWLAQKQSDRESGSFSMSNHFRAHYVFTDKGEGAFFYQVILPFAD